ncbi:MAG: flagellar hook-basal body complex protein FliE, partial [Methylophilaceae bacterium]
MKTGGIDSARIESMLAQMKAAAQRPQVRETNGLSLPTGIQKSEKSDKVNFSDALKASLNQVNQT